MHQIKKDFPEELTVAGFQNRFRNVLGIQRRKGIPSRWDSIGKCTLARKAFVQFELELKEVCD